MSIANTENKGSWLDIYDEKGHRTGTITLNQGDTVVGVTAVSVSIKHNNWVDTYDEKGHRTGTRSCN